MAMFRQPGLPAGKAPLSNLSRLRDVAALGCVDPDLAVRQVQVYDWFEQWNQRFFSNRLRPVHINVSLTSYGKTLGLCHYRPVQYIEIHPRCWRSAPQHVGSMVMPSAAWVVLHEMIHLAEVQTRGDVPGNCHATPDWVGWCNYIAEQLDMPLSYAQMARGKSSVAEGRKNVWKPACGASVLIRPGTRLADYDETRCFPYVAADPLMEENSEERDGQTQLPQF
jgi:hypothetical protein